jgi:branched-chain amino acid transport system substrate-binding protein
MKIRRLFRGVALAPLLAIAACGGTTPSSAPASSASAAASAKPAASAGAAVSAAPVTGSAAATSPGASVSAAAASAAKPAASGQTTKVGYIQTLTGPTANVGKDNLDGFNLYLESVGGTIAGRKIEVVTADDGGKPDVGVTKAKQLVESDHVNILMGINLTPVCYAVAAYAREAQVPFAETGNCAAERLTTDPKFKSPYLTRFTFTGTGNWDPAADWSYKNGYRKAIIAASDFGPGLEATDIFASAFIERGGSVVQEIHPPAGTTDFGTYLAGINKDADFIGLMMSGIDGLRFLEQIGDLGGSKKLPIVDFGGATKGPNLAQLKQKALGIVGGDQWTSAIDTPMNKSFMKAFQDKYSGRFISGDVALGYAGGQVLGAAVQKIDGAAENKQQLLEALYATNLETVRGPVKLDSDHDIVPTTYLFQIAEQGGTIDHKLLASYPDSSRTWDRPQSEIDHLDLGGMKGKWVGMTKDQLEKLAKG